MNPGGEQRGLLNGIREYVLNLRDNSPYWRYQAAAIGVLLLVLIGTVVFFAMLTLSAISGGGAIAYDAKGSPGPVVFDHYTHMWFQNGKYKDCKVCHDKLFATNTYGTFVLRALRESPSRKVRIGKDTSTLYIPQRPDFGDVELVTYEVPRACKTCATGECHNGKESFSRFECLKCHKRR